MPSDRDWAFERLLAGVAFAYIIFIAILILAACCGGAS